MNFNDLEDLIECDKEPLLSLNPLHLKLDPLLSSSFPLFDSPPSSSHSSSVPSSPSSFSTFSSSASSIRKRVKSSMKHKEPFEINHSSDDETFELCSMQRRRKKKKYYKSNSSVSQSNSTDDTASERPALSLKDPMMSISHSPSHFSNDLSNYMDQMFFSSSQYLTCSLTAEDNIDFLKCTILKTEYDNDDDHDWLDDDRRWSKCKKKKWRKMKVP